MNILPRSVLYRILASVVVVAVLTATTQAALIFGAIGPIIAALMGLCLIPTLVRGASSGRMPPTTVWVVATVGLIICEVATIGLDPVEFNSISIWWYPCGILAGAVMVWMAGHRLQPMIVVIYLLIHVSIWAGPAGMVRLGFASEIVLVMAGLIMHRAVRRVTEATRTAAAQLRETVLLQAQLNAFQLERRERLRTTSLDVSPMLRRIIRMGGELDRASRRECRVMEQTLRDEIRGRRLLNDAVRSVVLAHRRRGALVLVLDDGGLDDLGPREVDVLLNDVARRLEPLQSSRIVIRTGQPKSATAVTIVASTPDETAVALGLDSDDEVELWAAIPRPTVGLVS